MSRTAALMALAFAALVAAPLAAQTPANMTGKWEFTYSTQRGATTMTLVLEQAGEALTGTIQMPGRGGQAASPVAISDGTIKGADFSFAVVRAMGERSMEQKFTGKVTGDTAEGTMSGMRGRGGNAAEPIKWTAKRMPSG